MKTAVKYPPVPSLHPTYIERNTPDMRKVYKSS